MYDSFLVAFNAVMPFLIYLSIGALIVRLGLADVPFMNRLNKVTFRALFPFLMFYNIYQAAPEAVPSVKLMVTVVASILAVIAILMLIVPRIVPGNPQRGVIIQGIFRSNFALYGAPLTIFVFGQERASIAGMVVMLVVATFNISAVIVLEYFNSADGVQLRSLPGKLVKNPLLQGCMLGLIFFLAKIKLPTFLATAVSGLAGIVTPLALITLGGVLQFSAVKKNFRILAPVLAVKLVLLPLIMLLLAYAIGLRGVELFLVMMIYAAPVATSSYPMAVNMGGDGELAGQLVFLSTVISLLTVFLFIFSVSQAGWLGI